MPLTKSTGRGREGRIVPRTKSDRPRVIELDSRTVSARRAAKARQAEERLLMGAAYDDKGFVFCRPDGRPYHPEAFSKTFARRLEQPAFVDLPRIRLHDLRHTWATLALIAGVQSDAAERVADLIFGAGS